MTAENKNQEQGEEVEYDRNLKIQFISTRANFTGEGTKKEKSRFRVGVVPRTLVAAILLAFVGNGCLETRNVIEDYAKQTRKKIRKCANEFRSQSHSRNRGQYG